jgi:hypothetical protein
MGNDSLPPSVRRLRSLAQRLIGIPAVMLCMVGFTGHFLSAQTTDQSATGAAGQPSAQNAGPVKRDPQGRPDLTGMWNSQYTPDLRRAVDGGELPFTAYGAERWKNVDLKDDPTGLCLPVGPSRAFTAPFPVYFVQTPTVIGVLFEYQTIWRLFYVGAEHPANLSDYSEFMGHSIAKWEGDALVVDTVNINERSWLDTAGHEHSDKLHLTERFEKLSEAAIKYTLTYDDPAFFTKPFTIVRTLERADAKDRMLPYSCEENNVDKDHVVSLKPNLKTE